MTPADAANFPIVGIGASAGGVPALESFFSGVPDHPGVSFVVVTHLSPERESMLHEIVARYTSLPVHIATDGMRVEVDNVYVLSADAILSITGRCLRISKPQAARRERKPIDIFFSALAADCGEFAAGVVLSGGDGDGTLGIKAIKERGGLTLAQVSDGNGPRFPDMPDSAIASGLVDLAVPAEEMGQKLVAFARSQQTLDDAGAGSRSPDDDAALDGIRPDIYAILRNQVGHDFGGYKTNTFMRRVKRRMHIRQVEKVDDYVEMLRQEPGEVAALFRDLLINVTTFFRDAEAFDTLAQTIVPRLFDGRGAEDVVRIWVPGCATGEEVYSLAMLLCEYMHTLTAVPRVQIFATDIDERSLNVARAGRYPAPLLDSVSAERREKFFIPDGGSFVVSKQVRDICIFSPHSVIRDPPFSRIDLVSCRNLLIYFGLEVQHRVIPTFHYALREGGFLFLGTSENIGQFDHLFDSLDKKHRIFQRRSDAAPGVSIPSTIRGFRPGRIAELHGTKQLIPLSGGVRQAAEAQVLEQFAPPYVVVSSEGDIVFYSTRTGKYLEAAAGVPTRQILALARKGLRLDLRTALQEVVETGQPVTRDDVAIEGDDSRVQMISLIITPVAEAHGDSRLFLVIFIDHGRTLSRDEAVTRLHVEQDGAAARLERELRDTRERLQSLIEEYETALEELKSSNEELVSVNEELQSTNEELEASKEELQSVNEELHTVNTDLNIKIESLDHARSDLQNLFDSTDVATLFLDQNMTIRSFTPAVANVFNILPSDRGRPLTDLSAQFHLPNLTEDIAAALAGEAPIERRVTHSARNAHYLVRFAPYRNTDKKNAGVVVTFLDVTTITQAQERLAMLLAEVQHRTRNLLAVIQSIAMQTIGRGAPADDFFDRLNALGRVQSLISRSPQNAISLEEMLRLELEAHGRVQEQRVTIRGPAVALDTLHLQSLALVIHELATNSVKYGALKEPNATLSVTWGVESDGSDGLLLRFIWQEDGVKPPTDTSKRGYGRKLIERSLSFSLRAKTEFTFREGGVFCQIEFPFISQTQAGLPGTTGGSHD